MFQSGVSSRRRLARWTIGVSLLLAGTAFAQQATPPAQPVPDAPSVKRAPDPTAAQKREGGAANNFRDFAHQLFSPGTVLMPAASAGIAQATSDDHAYAPGGEGYAYRFGNAVADNADGKFMRAFLMPTLFNQVEHYRPLGEDKRGGQRFAHVLAHSFVTKTRNGNNTFNMSGIPASMATAAVGNYYYPDKYATTWHMMQRAGYMQAGYFAGDFWTEFKPDICRSVHLRCGRRKP